MYEAFYRGSLGTNQCSWENDKVPCKNQAIVHVFLKRVLLEDGTPGSHCILSCKEHEFSGGTAHRHPVNPECDMPGTVWFDEGCKWPE